MSLELRPIAAADAPMIHSITRAAEVSDGSTLATTLAEIELRLDGPHLDLERDTRLAVLDGAAVGFAYVDHTPSGERLERAYLWGEVAPEHRRQGVGSALFEWELARAAEILEAYDHDLPRYARTHQRTVRADAIALYERHGLTAVRWTDELIRPLDERVSLDPPPDDVQIVPWASELTETVRLVKNAAFADHWGSTPSDEEAWAHWLADESVRLDLSTVAVVGGEVVGYSLNEHYAEDEAVTGRRDGWIQSLGVLRAFRGRGVASALIAASIDAFRSAGFTHAVLDVDTENPSGAYGLYQRLGFEPLERHVTHQIEVRRRP